MPSDSYGDPWAWNVAQKTGVERRDVGEFVFLQDTRNKVQVSIALSLTAELGKGSELIADYL